MIANVRRRPISSARRGATLAAPAAGVAPAGAGG
jgi:hypothetical protein